MLYILYAIVGISLGILVSGGISLLRGQNRRQLPPCAVRPRLLDPEERATLSLLERVTGDHVRVLPKVSLGSIVDPIEPVHDLEHHKRRLARQVVDFILCSPSTLAPMVAVQLTENRRRSAIVVRSLELAGLPLVHLERGKKHDAAALRVQLHMLISGRRVEPRDLPPVIEPNWSDTARNTLGGLRGALEPVWARLRGISVRHHV
ncbi:MAG: DUF2726 domain-containing protein [Gammaproteobacteria bacterium]|jgi:hypothetical protein|nr:DUF2726 domain-containing protein [Gammaproteobacteria bacterium]